MNYSDWITAVCVLLEYDAEIVDPSSAQPTSNDAFNNIYPRAIEYTENRLRRDINPEQIVRTAQGPMTPNSKSQNLPAAPQGRDWIIIERVSVISGGVIQPSLEPVSREYLDFAWPDNASPGAGILPVQWSFHGLDTLLVGPAPDQAYVYEVMGTTDVVPLSSTNNSNTYTQLFPEIYLACSMIFFSGYQRDFGQQADDPKMAQSWENQYQLLLSSAQTEEAKKRYANMLQGPSTPAPVTA